MVRLLAAGDNQLDLGMTVKSMQERCNGQTWWVGDGRLLKAASCAQWQCAASGAEDRDCRYQRILTLDIDMHGDATAELVHACIGYVFAEKLRIEPRQPIAVSRIGPQIRQLHSLRSGGFIVHR